MCLPLAHPQSRWNNGEEGRVGEQVCIDLDPSVYSVEAVLAASYWESGGLCVAVESVSPSLRISISTRDSSPVSQETVDQFVIRLTDHELRVRLRRQFAPMENAIVAKAFAPIGGATKAG